MWFLLFIGENSMEEVWDMEVHSKKDLFNTQKIFAYIIHTRSTLTTVLLNLMPSLIVEVT